MTDRAVLFDFDGVLVDSANLHVAAWERVFTRMGWEVPPDRCVQAAEIDDRLFFRKLCQERSLADFNVDGYVRLKQAWMKRSLADADRLHRGITDLVPALRSSYRLAVVTSTWRENVEAALARDGLTDAFELLVCKEDVHRPKPAPDPYLKALERLELEPARCVAIEDSETGVTAAESVGLACLAVGHGRDAGPWCRAATYIEDLRDTRAVLDAILRLTASTSS